MTTTSVRAAHSAGGSIAYRFDARDAHLRDQTLEITFAEPGVRAYVFTFG